MWTPRIASLWLRVFIRLRFATPAGFTLLLSVVSLAACGDAGSGTQFDAGFVVDASFPPPDVGDVKTDVAAFVDAISVVPTDSATDAAPTSDRPNTRPISCTARPTCDMAAPAPGPTLGWANGGGRGEAKHYGRDNFFKTTETQWAIARFAYGLLDSPLEGERVDIFVARNCGTWEMLGTATTTREGSHPTTELVEDKGGYVYFQIPAAQRLPIGRHRLHFVVRGDNTTTDAIIDVVAPTQKFVLSDVDGTLTDSEVANFLSILVGSPGTQPGAPEACTDLANRGYAILYLTARPINSTQGTRDWFRMRNFPIGVIHTTQSRLGALGSAATDYKREEIAAHLARFPNSIEWAFGNTDTDKAGYEMGGVPSRAAYFVDFDSGGYGRRIDDYRELLTTTIAAPLACE